MFFIEEPILSTELWLIPTFFSMLPSPPEGLSACGIERSGWYG